MGIHCGCALWETLGIGAEHSAYIAGAHMHEGGIDNDTALPMWEMGTSELRTKWKGYL